MLFRSLQFALRYICPGEDWSWLLKIAKRIATQAKRKPEKHHLVTSETLYALGIELMDRAIANGKSGTWRVLRAARCSIHEILPIFNPNQKLKLLFQLGP